MRARVYIDGFNVYYRLLKGSQYKWCNLKALSSRLLPKDAEIEAIRYFTADVSPRAGDPEAPVRQATYFRALKTIPELTIHKGNFLAKKIWRPLVGQESTKVQVHDSEEKGSDVNLASHLLMDCLSDTYDVALVLSQDTDLIEPNRMVTEDLGKTVIVGWLDNTSPGRRHKTVSTGIARVTKQNLVQSQFPNPVIGRGGAKIVCPTNWNKQPD